VICGLLKGEETNRMKRLNKLMIIGMMGLMVNMCVPPEQAAQANYEKEKAQLDSLRKVRCPRLMSSAAEYYRNQDWRQTVDIYKEIADLGCDEWNAIYAPPEEIYQYYSIAYEQMGKYDSAEVILLKGLRKIPENIELRKRLAYTYKRQGKIDQQMIEYERLVDLNPTDKTLLSDLAKLYKDEERYEDQILTLNKLMELDPSNEMIQSDLALAYESSGKDPLSIYQKRYEENMDNISYGLDFADRLMQAERADESVSILKRVIRLDNSSKLGFRKLAEASQKIDDLDGAASALETLFKIDPRDQKVAINLSDIYIDLNNFHKALKWANKAIDLNSETGAGFGQKGKVYYLAWDYLRQNPFTPDDRIVAKLAFDAFTKAEEKGYRGFNKKSWLAKNAKDVLYGKGQWFMADQTTKTRRKISTKSKEYEWVTDSIIPPVSWK
jgi:tetratricopeptide (TPR) repeat protein